MDHITLGHFPAFPWVLSHLRKRLYLCRGTWHMHPSPVQNSSLFMLYTKIEVHLDPSTCVGSVVTK